MSIPLQHVTVHGHDVGYRLAQSDPTAPIILLIHGMAGSSKTWREVMPALAEDFTVLAPDLIGHGESAKPMGDYSLGAYASGLRDLLATLDLGPVTVIGQSLGGGVAMQLAYQHPELVERMVLVGSGGLGREVSWLLRVLTLPGAEYLMPVLFPPIMRGQGDTVSRALHQRGWHAPRLAEMWRAYASLTQAENRAAFVRTLRAVLDPGGQSVSATDRLYLAAAMPTMIVWGDEDPIIPIEHGYAAHKAIPGSRLEVFEGAGHFPHVEDPNRFVDVVIDFMHTTDADRRGMVPFQELLTGT
ncbi:MAG: alpha/beta fold hydrolase [Acidimicrobiales bacterium]